jgi:hypothetical protein
MTFYQNLFLPNLFPLTHLFQEPLYSLNSIPLSFNYLQEYYNDFFIHKVLTIYFIVLRDML